MQFGEYNLRMATIMAFGERLTNDETCRESPTDAELALWKQAFPIAYPEMVNVFSEHHSVPAYFLYSIMSSKVPSIRIQ